MVSEGAGRLITLRPVLLYGLVVISGRILELQNFL